VYKTLEVLKDLPNEATALIRTGTDMKKKFDNESSIESDAKEVGGVKVMSIIQDNLSKVDQIEPTVIQNLTLFLDDMDAIKSGDSLIKDKTLISSIGM
jgi:hypothetical protein